MVLQVAEKIQVPGPYPQKFLSRWLDLDLQPCHLAFPLPSSNLPFPFPHPELPIQIPRFRKVISKVPFNSEFRICIIWESRSFVFAHFSLPGEWPRPLTHSSGLHRYPHSGSALSYWVSSQCHITTPPPMATHAINCPLFFPRRV